VYEVGYNYDDRLTILDTNSLEVLVEKPVEVFIRFGVQPLPDGRELIALDQVLNLWTPAEPGRLNKFFDCPNSGILSHVAGMGGERVFLHGHTVGDFGHVPMTVCDLDGTFQRLIECDGGGEAKWINDELVVSSSFFHRETFAAISNRDGELQELWRSTSPNDSVVGIHALGGGYIVTLHSRHESRRPDGVMRVFHLARRELVQTIPCPGVQAVAQAGEGGFWLWTQEFEDRVVRKHSVFQRFVRARPSTPSIPNAAM
jgi:hypothetical protein